MNPSNGSRYLKAAAFLIVSGALYACGGGGTSIAGSGELTQTQFNALLKTSTVFTDLTAKLAEDEKTIARMATFGHSASSPAEVAGRSTASFNPHGSVVTSAITFGPCPDMGQHIGDSTPDPAGTTFVYFKQCPINGIQYIYGVLVETGAIRDAAKTWYTSTDCSGSAIEIDDGEIFNRLALQQGVVFRSPKDNSMVMVAAGQAGASVTAHSDFSDGGVCTTEDTTAPGYSVSANDINVTGVPGSVPTDFIY